MIDRASFERYVQEALDHLYEPAFLMAHPLTTALVPVGSAESPHQVLHRVLREAINLLKPPADAPLHSPAWRLYRYLSLRYVEMLTIGQVAAELGISPRQCRRDHHDALVAICSILREKLLQPPPALAADVSEIDHLRIDEALLETELGKMGAASATVGTRLDRIAESVAATLSALALRKSVALQVVVPFSLPAVAVERTVLRQILLEILLDAIDRAAGGEVALSATSAGQQVDLVIFVRAPVEAITSRGVEPSRDEARLAVSQRLASLQGAGFVVDERLDGLEVKLSLPPAETPVVLVVDDNADAIHLFRRYLGARYEVHEATGGEQAMQLARSLRPGLITLDVMMPSQDGWEVLQTLKHDPATARIPVVVCSVLRERELALSLGAAEFLAKPVTAKELLSVLERCVPAP